MPSRKDRECVVCGKHYKYCSICEEFKNMPTWMNAYCSEECRDIYKTMNAYAFNHLTKNQAKKALKNKNIDKVTNQELVEMISSVIDVADETEKSVEE